MLVDPLLLLPLSFRTPGAVAIACLGGVAIGIERGWARRPSFPLSLGFALLAALAHLLTLSLVRAPTSLELLGRGAVILAVGTLSPRFASRFARMAAGWRAPVRCGPASGSIPLAEALATRPWPGLLGWAAWALTPAEVVVRGLGLLAILLYQLTASRLMPPACMFEPSCSRYGFEAIRRHGAVRGTALTALRVLRCSPLSSGGFDPVPGDPSGGYGEARKGAGS